MARVIGIFSGKGGVGKTTVVVNLAAALTGVFKKNVLVLDTNLNTSHIGLHLGIYEDPAVTLREVIKRRVSPMYALFIHPGTGIRLIPSPLSGDGVTLTQKKLSDIVEKLKQDNDLILLDAAPGLGREVVTAANVVDGALIITTPDLPAVSDALKTVELLTKMNRKVLGVVVNRSRGQKYELTTKEVAHTCGADVIATVPEDGVVPESISKGSPAVAYAPKSRAARALKSLAASLIGQTYSEPSLIERLMGILKIRKPAVVKQEVQKEVQEVKGLQTDLTAEVKEQLKQEIMQKLKEKLQEKEA